MIFYIFSLFICMSSHIFPYMAKLIVNYIFPFIVILIQNKRLRVWLVQIVIKKNKIEIDLYV